MAYETTEVTVSRSQEQIRGVLRKHQAARINFGEEFTAEGASIGVEFVHADTLVRLLAKVNQPAQKLIAEKMSRQRSGKTRDEIVHDLTEQEARRMWRVLHWAIKVRMEAVEEGLRDVRAGVPRASGRPAFGTHLVGRLAGRS